VFPSIAVAFCNQYHALTAPPATVPQKLFAAEALSRSGALQAPLGLKPYLLSAIFHFFIYFHMVARPVKIHENPPSPIESK
jgi:hypothetical protein